ncbi:hypothetical protein CNBG_9205 [Cryptococcus deuterogattii R265]|uniref:uncharacterized protein n=1 Tax=Cryptococcus deuterogattii (strain R265) TaxID=294750 RepID=UPI00193627ED|nr:hypothetical protein CNBG_9205 [Cryptococcus deuterogattii R265]
MSFVQLVTISAKKECRARILDRESGNNRLEEPPNSLAPVLAGIRAEAEEKEPGTRIFDIAISKDDQNLIFVWEEYASEEAIQAHRDGAICRDFLRERAELMTGPMKVQRADRLP